MVLFQGTTKALEKVVQEAKGNLLLLLSLYHSVNVSALTSNLHVHILVKMIAELENHSVKEKAKQTV